MKQPLRLDWDGLTTVKRGVFVILLAILAFHNLRSGGRAEDLAETVVGTVKDIQASRETSEAGLIGPRARRSCSGNKKGNVPHRSYP